MTVAELIKALQEIDKDTPVYVWGEKGYCPMDNFDLYYNENLNRLEVS